MTLAVQITPLAEAQIREIDRWWRANRTAAPNLFSNELENALGLIAEVPLIGRVYRKSSRRIVRRIFLSKSRYHVYYLLQQEALEVITVWHAQRGAAPPLPHSA